MSRLVLGLALLAFTHAVVTSIDQTVVWINNQNAGAIKWQVSEKNISVPYPWFDGNDFGYILNLNSNYNLILAGGTINFTRDAPKETVNSVVLQYRAYPQSGVTPPSWNNIPFQLNTSSYTYPSNNTCCSEWIDYIQTVENITDPATNITTEQNVTIPITMPFCCNATANGPNLFCMGPNGTECFIPALTQKLGYQRNDLSVNMSTYTPPSPGLYFLELQYAITIEGVTTTSTIAQASFSLRTSGSTIMSTYTAVGCTCQSSFVDQGITHYQCTNKRPFGGSSSWCAVSHLHPQGGCGTWDGATSGYSRDKCVHQSCPSNQGFIYGDSVHGCYKQSTTVDTFWNNWIWMARSVNLDSFSGTVLLRFSRTGGGGAIYGVDQINITSNSIVVESESFEDGSYRWFSTFDNLPVGARLTDGGTPNAWTIPAASINGNSAYDGSYFAMSSTGNSYMVHERVNLDLMQTPRAVKFRVITSNGGNPKLDIFYNSGGCTQNNGGCSQVRNCSIELGAVVCGPCPTGQQAPDPFTCADIDECEQGLCNAFNTPRDNSTCTNSFGSYSCSCPAGYTGNPLVAPCTDINECTNGVASCAAETPCQNTQGFYFCSSRIAPTSVMLLPNTVWSSLIQFSGSGTFTFVVNHVENTTDEVEVIYGDGTLTFSCDNATTEDLSTTQTRYYCDIYYRLGHNYYFSIVVYNPDANGTATLPDPSNTLFATPTPTITPSTIRTYEGENDTRVFAPSTVSNLVMVDSEAHMVSFNGTNLSNDPDMMKIYFGSPTSPLLYQCTLVPEYSSSIHTVCTTQQGAQGAQLQITIFVGNHKVVAVNNTISYPLNPPKILQVTGCTDQADGSTINCPTKGNIPITIYGENFFPDILLTTATVKGRKCPVDYVDAQKVVCYLPAGSGFGATLVVATGNPTQNTPASTLLSYAGPTFTALYGCAKNGGSPVSLVDCKRTGERITIEGENLGDPGATILIGNSECTNVTSPSTPLASHTTVSCDLPPGPGLGRSVLLLQKDGSISRNSIATISYLECPEGTSEAGTACELCVAGYFSSVRGLQDCLPCEFGKFSVQGGTYCQECPVGRSQPEQGKDFCTKCSPGTYAPTNGSQSCRLCEPGRYSDEEGLENPLPCPAGTFQSNTGKSFCTSCASGRFSAGGAAECSVCPEGSVAPLTGSQSCSSCPTSQRAVAVDSLKCVCPKGTYSSYKGGSVGLEIKCEDCPAGAECNEEGLEWSTIKSSPGYFRLEHSFVRCLLLSHCPGKTSAMNSSQCAANREGPLCAVCEEGYRVQLGDPVCRQCPSKAASAGLSLVFALLLAFGLVVIYWIVLRGDRKEVETEKGKVNSFERLEKELPSLDTSVLNTYVLTQEKRSKLTFTYNLKILLGFLQIATTLLSIVEIQWPSYFQAFVSAFSFVNLDFIPWSSIQCVGNFDYYTKFYAYTFVPFGVLVLIVVCGFGWFYISDYLWQDWSDERSVHVHRKVYIQKLVKLVLFTVFLLYPGVSARVLQYFLCREVDGVTYLVADFSIVCYDARWERNLATAVIMILIYPVGVPLITLGILFYYRHHLQTDLDVLRKFGFLYEAYHADYWFFEIIDMSNKLLLTSVIPFFDISGRLPGALAIIGCYTIVILLANPYVRRIDDTLHRLVQTELFLLLLAGHVLRASVEKMDETMNVLLSILLISVIIVLIGLFFIHVIQMVKRKYFDFVRKKLGFTREGDSIADTEDDDTGTTMSQGSQGSWAEGRPKKGDDHTKQTTPCEGETEPGETRPLRRASSELELQSFTDKNHSDRPDLDRPSSDDHIKSKEKSTIKPDDRKLDMSVSHQSDSRFGVSSLRMPRRGTELDRIEDSTLEHSGRRPAPLVLGGGDGGSRPPSPLSRSPSYSKSTNKPLPPITPRGETIIIKTPTSTSGSRSEPTTPKSKSKPLPPTTPRGTTIPLKKQPSTMAGWESDMA